MKRLAFIIVTLLVSGCGIFTARDSAPPITLDPDNIADAIPKREPITTAGNRSPYKVLGKTYHIRPEVGGYVEEGIGSWYGTKFHGRKTSNGEIYSLYKATAAHKTLPIPCYAKVTNLENGREIIVRVNDRGPFHEGRIIDLSYAAAVKLGYDKQGTARVRVEAIDPASLSGLNYGQRYYLQAGSFKSLISAQNFRDKLQRETGTTVSVMTSDIPGFYRVLLGPFTDYAKVEQLDGELRARNLATPRVITE